MPTLDDIRAAQAEHHDATEAYVNALSFEAAADAVRRASAAAKAYDSFRYQCGPKPIDYSGQRFGKLTAEGRAAFDRHNKTYWLCQCDCGQRRTVRTSDLTRGQTQTCGKCNIKPKAPTKTYLSKAIVRPPREPVNATNDPSVMLGLARNMRKSGTRWEEVAEVCGAEVADTLRAETLVGKEVAP